jgi:hypothetical protein
MVANSPLVSCDLSQRHRGVPLSSGTSPKQHSIGDAKVGLTLNRISADCADCPAGRGRRHDVDAETSRARSCRRGEAYSTGPEHLQAVFYNTSVQNLARRSIQSDRSSGGSHVGGNSPDCGFSRLYLCTVGRGDWSMNMRRAILRVALITVLAGGASAQGGMTSTGTQTPGSLALPGTTTSQGTTTSPGQPGGVPQAPVGHRQPTATDVPALKSSTSTTPDQTITPSTPTSPTTIPSAPARGRSAQTRGRAGGPPVLQVVTSCEAAGRGAVVLGRNKEACLADETAAQDTLKQNWAKYAANDKTQCVGMTTTGGPSSYVELLSCLEIMRDARQIQNADPLESDTATAANTAPTSRRRHR